MGGGGLFTNFDPSVDQRVSTCDMPFDVKNSKYVHKNKTKGTVINTELHIFIHMYCINLFCTIKPQNF